MSGDVAERIKCFRFVRDIPYYIALSDNEQDYCCATKTPMLQKLLAGLDIKSRQINCQFDWAGFGLPPDVLAEATSPHCAHVYLEVFIPEKNEWVAVDPTWDNKLQSAGLPIAEWDGLNPTVLAVKPVKTFSAEESQKVNQQMDGMPPETMQKFYKDNHNFISAINNWLDGCRRQSEKHAA